MFLPVSSLFVQRVQRDVNVVWCPWADAWRRVSSGSCCCSELVVKWQKGPIVVKQPWTLSGTESMSDPDQTDVSCFAVAWLLLGLCQFVFRTLDILPWQPTYIGQCWVFKTSAAQLQTRAGSDLRAKKLHKASPEEERFHFIGSSTHFWLPLIITQKPNLTVPLGCSIKAQWGLMLCKQLERPLLAASH